MLFLTKLSGSLDLWNGLKYYERNFFWESAESNLWGRLNLQTVAALLQGEILIETRSHSAWGAALTAQMYLPLGRSLVWQKLTDYPRWVYYFPDIIISEIIQKGNLSHSSKRLHQVARKAFLFITVQVEIYLRVMEVVQQQIQFRMEKGNFADFTADLKLQDYESGTLLTYSVQATPDIPIPSLFVQQAMQLDLPANLRRMRQIICGN